MKSNDRLWLGLLVRLQILWESVDNAMLWVWLRLRLQSLNASDDAVRLCEAVFKASHVLSTPEAM